MTCKPSKYTGADKVGHRRPGTDGFVRAVSRASGRKLYSLGTFMVRTKRGKNTLSVHATGRAMDIGRSKWRTLGGGSRAYLLEVIDWMVANCEAMGLEMIVDYQWTGKLPNGKPAAGRVWKCDRCAWKAQVPGSIQGAGSGTWIHVELDGKHADSTDWIAPLIESMPRPPKTSA